MTGDEPSQGILSPYTSRPARDACRLGCIWTAGFSRDPYLDDCQKRSEGKDDEHTVAQNAVKLELRQESKPIDTILLVLPKFCLDRNRNFVLLHFAAVEQLGEECSFFFPLAQQFVREVWWIGKTRLKSIFSVVLTKTDYLSGTYLQRYHLD